MWLAIWMVSGWAMWQLPGSTSTTLEQEAHQLKVDDDGVFSKNALPDGVLPKSSTGKAVRYLLNNWKALNVFTTDGRLTIDNNLSERTVRALAIGRKNWQFIGSEAAGYRMAVRRQRICDSTSSITKCGTAVTPAISRNAFAQSANHCVPVTIAEAANRNSSGNSSKSERSTTPLKL